MKTTTEKAFDAVRFMREQRDKMSSKHSKMTEEEIVKYFNINKMESKTKSIA